MPVWTRPTGNGADHNRDVSVQGGDGPDAVRDQIIFTDGLDLTVADLTTSELMVKRRPRMGTVCVSSGTSAGRATVADSE